MEIKRGIPVSPGVAIGPAFVFETEGIHIPRRYIDPAQAAREIERLRQGLSEAVRDARTNQEAISEKLGKQYGAIFAAHALLIEDPELIREIENMIVQKHYSAEYAVSRAMRRHAKAMESLNHPLFSTRSSDLIDIEKSILSHLAGEPGGDPLDSLQEPVIILAHDLTPSETANLNPKLVYAFATEAGGKASHTAIMAGVLEIPAVVGLGKLLMDVSGGDEVIVDGNRGVVILNPDEETRERYLVLQRQFGSFAKRLLELRDLPAETKDGCQATLLGNIEFPQEAPHCIERGASGVGLYRTEFLYLNKTNDPDENEQYDAYMSVIRALGPGKPVVIRTLDLGADKWFQKFDPHHEKNPFLGLRSVRLCLRNLPLFKTQLRAILRASHHGDVRIMFPMVSTLMELRQCKMILADVKEELDEENIPFHRKLPVGTMIEVPSAALIAEELAKEVNFFSIGTNDLIQYTLAADRNNESVAGLYNAGDPSVLRLIDHVIRAAMKAQIEVCVCGEMSGDPIYTMLLLGLGLRQMSMTPQNIPEIKKIIRTVTIEEAKQVAQEAMRLETARDVNNYLREQTRRVLPEVVVN